MSYQDWERSEYASRPRIKLALPWNQGFYNRLGKRTLDICVVLFVAPFVLPIVVFSALVIALDGTNPFYVQERVGFGNKVFKMWKLRSMVPNSKKVLEDLLENDPKSRHEWGENQKLKRDPRITWFGRFIRKFSIDELPQFWNVARGDMSVVGPRPMMPEQRCLYPGTSYYRLRPGITGLWQVTDRNKSTFAARSEFDLTYANSVSAKLDILILLLTLKVVVKGTGY
ncbi:sugar transferase [Shimia sediminis]|uniref:sugar transferase n=1 Tax=Shimia sediminis TaxID=2497945 RepID=UPI000F8C81DA|nr:sugar transferase [Shimia sediminis]